MTHMDDGSTAGLNPVAEILEALMRKHRLNQTDLANRSGVSQPGINRILKERSKAKQPRRETLEKIAAVLGVTPDQLAGHEPIPARMLNRNVVPVRAWEDLLPADSSDKPDQRGWLACPIEHSDETFALPVLGDAMRADDGYREGEILFIDPAAPPAHGKDVVVLNGTTALFRRLVVTSEGRFLTTLNPAWPTPIIQLPHDAVFYGTVIFSGRIR
ncbi:MAG: LexA family transcriptional regulator [Candidatus Accumulibacter sp.]|uniref:LexA family protein n=1 Tax=Accumulibacter sp. TaxID=2053492 RepID=UPI001A4FB216|nr:LexA family transcriptional regulator [Accumulibacter sp.]MBL8395324.1 LexA family transcriptional regulator [Accumulibacter sp.]